MLTFDPQHYGPAAPLLDPDHIAELGPGTPNEAAREPLRQLTVETLFAGQTVVNRNMAQCCLAGLWLEHNFLDQSHQISQEIHTTTGSYWHAIMHRREPDFFNSKYWFRRVGEHPIFAPLTARARDLAAAAQLDSRAAFLATQVRWDPFQFVELCEAALCGGTKNVELCRQIAQAEWRLLFEHCYRRALGKG